MDLDKIKSEANLKVEFEKYKQESEKKKAKVIATGGFSKFAAAHSSEIHHVETFLVLEGIQLIYNRLYR